MLFIIRGYQLYISPHKGFCCAYKKLHNEQSCSSYFYTCVENYDLSTASTLLQERFKDCDRANKVLKSKANTVEKQNSQQPSKKGNNSCCCSGQTNQKKKPKPNTKQRSSKKQDREIIDPNDVYDCCSLDYVPICGLGNTNSVTYDSNGCCGDTRGCDGGGCDSGGCDSGGCDSGGCDSGGCG